MITLKSLRLHNIVTYDDAEFNLEKQGISVIYGRNKDSGNLESQSNGAGKSKLFTVLAETLADAHPLISGRQAVKDDFYRPDAKVEVGFDKYRLTKSKVGSAVKYALARWKDGVWHDLKSREPLDKLAEIFPVSLDEFFTLYYIDSSRPSVLQRGTHASRFKLFTDLFKLNGYDVVLAEVKELAKELKAKEKVLAEITGQMATIDLPHSADDLEEDLEAAQRKLATLEKKEGQLKHILSLRKVYGQLEDDLALVEKEGWDYTFDGLNAIHKRVSKAVKSSANQESAYLTYLRKQDKYKEDLAAYQHGQYRLEKYGVSTLKEIKALVSLAKSYEEAEDHNRAVKKALKSLKPMSEPEGKRPKQSQERYAAQIAVYKEKADELGVQLDELAELNTKHVSTCPTCHSEIKPKHLKMVFDTLTEKRQEFLDAAERAARLSELARDWELYDDYVAEKEKLESSWMPLPSLDFDLEAFVADLHVLKEAVDAEKPTPPEKVEKPADRTQQVKLQSACKTVLNFLDDIQAYKDEGAGDYDEEELDSADRKLASRISKAAHTVQELLKQAGAAASAFSQYEALDEKKQALEEELSDLPLLKILEQAYSPKGLKNIAMVNLCSKVEKNLNLYAPLLYAEPVKFILDVSETQFNILIQRVFDGKKVTCDVRRLSGAESRQFNLLFPMALLPLVPYPQRLNVMVLDEPTANLDDAAVDLFTSSFLPKLRELVPHVIVLSPNPLPLDRELADVYCVTRDNGVSVLEAV